MSPKNDETISFQTFQLFYFILIFIYCFLLRSQNKSLKEYLKICIFVCMCDHGCKSVCHMHARVPRVLKMVPDPLERNLQVVMNSWCGCWEQNLSPLQGQQGLLTSQLPLSQQGWPSGYSMSLNTSPSDPPNSISVPISTFEILDLAL